MDIHQGQQKRRVKGVAWAIALGFGLLAGGVADAGDCLDPGESITEINRLLLEVELEDARDLAVRAQQDLLCQNRAVNTLVLSSLYDAIGATHFYLEDEAQATVALERSLAVSPAGIVDGRYGVQVQERYQEIQTVLQELENGSFTLIGQVTAWVDGRPLPMGTRTDLAPGSHLLQWRLADGVLQNRIIDLGPGESRRVQLGTPDLSRQRILLASGGGLLATSAVLFVVARKRYQDFEDYGDDPSLQGDDEPSSSTLEGIYNENHALVISGVGVAVVGIGLMGAGAMAVDGRFLFTLSGRW